MSIQQKSLFGAKSVPIGATDKNKPKQVVTAARTSFPKLTLDYGFDKAQLNGEAVFWHRIIINQHSKKLFEARSKRKFVRAVLSEMKIKQGKRTPELLTLDMLLMQNLG